MRQGSKPMSPFNPPKAVRARPLAPVDRDQAIACLARNFPATDAAYWRRGWDRLTARARMGDLPILGHGLEADGALVGVLLMIYSTRGEGESRTVVANLSSWCVDPPYRAFSGALASAATRDKSVVYVNISAAPHTWPGVEAQGYRRYNSGQFLFAPALAKRAPGARARPFDEGRAEPGLSGEERTLLADHARLGCRTFVVDCDARSYGFATVGERMLRGKLRCGLIVHCGGLDRLARFAGALGRDMRLRLLIVDAPGPIPGLVGKFIAGRNPRYSKGPNQLALGDLVYTERVYLAP